MAVTLPQQVYALRVTLVVTLHASHVFSHVAGAEVNVAPSNDICRNFAVRCNSFCAVFASHFLLHSDLELSFVISHSRFVHFTSQRTGSCRFGNNCRFQHIQVSERTKTTHSFQCVAVDQWISNYTRTATPTPSSDLLLTSFVLFSRTLALLPPLLPPLRSATAGREPAHADSAPTAVSAT